MELKNIKNDWIKGLYFLTNLSGLLWFYFLLKYLLN
jgi:hypothetical protein